MNTCLVTDCTNERMTSVTGKVLQFCQQHQQSLWRDYKATRHYSKTNLQLTPKRLQVLYQIHLSGSEHVAACDGRVLPYLERKQLVEIEDQAVRLTDFGELVLADETAPNTEWQAGARARAMWDYAPEAILPVPAALQQQRSIVDRLQNKLAALQAKARDLQTQIDTQALLLQRMEQRHREGRL